MQSKIHQLYGIYILIGILILVGVDSSAQKYCIDIPHKTVKNRKEFIIKRWLKPDAVAIAQKQVRIDNKNKKKALKAEYKSLINYQKSMNNVYESGKKRKVYQRMKQYEKVSKRIRAHKHPKTKLQLWFSKDRKQKRKHKKSIFKQLLNVF